jgi:hypothetical protein
VKGGESFLPSPRIVNDAAPVLTSSLVNCTEAERIVEPWGMTTPPKRTPTAWSRVPSWPSSRSLLVRLIAPVESLSSASSLEPDTLAEAGTRTTVPAGTKVARTDLFRVIVMVAGSEMPPRSPLHTRNSQPATAEGVRVTVAPSA